jgi:hypothetical protein
VIERTRPHDTAADDDDTGMFSHLVPLENGLSHF